MLVLHIGRHKTGTTSLQRFLHHNRQELSRLGIHYPEPFDAVAAHHGLALALSKDRDISPYLQTLRQHDPHAQTVLLSSEAFQVLDLPQLCRLTTEFPTRPVVYLREQFGYAWSSYTQRVLANSETQMFSQSIKAPRYSRFLRKWDEGSDGNLTTRLYERKRFKNGDVVDDFCHSVLGLDPAVLSPVPMPYGSLGWRAINFARRLNELISEQKAPVRLKRPAIRALRDAAVGCPALTEKPIFPERLRQDFQARFVEDNKKVALQYFETTSPLFDTSWNGDSEWNEREALVPNEIERMLNVAPALSAHRDTLSACCR